MRSTILQTVRHLYAKIENPNKLLENQQKVFKLNKKKVEMVSQVTCVLSKQIHACNILPGPLRLFQLLNSLANTVVH